MKTNISNLLLVAALIATLNLLLASRATAITVTNTADSGAGTLREALANAANGDTIDATGVSGTILLTSGELLVTNSVTILGPGPANLAVDGNAAGRVFHISGTVVTIAGLTITNGRADSGGGINTGPGTLTVSNCTLSGNSATNGGGIYNDGNAGSATLTLSACTLSDNSATNYGGGIYNDGYNGSATLTVSASTLSGNSVSTYGGGGVFNGCSGSSGTGSVQIVTSTLSGNSASGSFGLGGGIFNSPGSSANGTVQIVTSTLSGNSASGAYGGGGGIFNGPGSSANGTVQIVTSTLSGNSAGGNFGVGGGIFNGPGSSANGTVQIVTSTLSGNSAGGSFGFGGCIYNSAGSGNANAHVAIGSSILNAGAGGNIYNASGTISSDGYNLSSDNGGGFLTGTADQINTDPILGPLQDNGGPTFTHALLPGSPAIDQGKNLTGSATDQRGLPRTVDIPSIPNAVGSDGTDIGAVEFQAPLLSNPGVGAGQYGFNLTGEPNQPVVVEASTNLVSWTALATNTLGASPLHFSDPGSANYRQRFYRAQLLP